MAGEISFFELGVGDFEAACTFYGGLFGWAFEPGPTEGGGCAIQTPNVRVATAPASRVAVMTHVALAGVVFRSSGRSLTTGTSRVRITATVMPAKAKTRTRAMPLVPRSRASGGLCAGLTTVVGVPEAKGNCAYRTEEAFP
jgi:hypothetical protein